MWRGGCYRIYSLDGYFDAREPRHLGNVGLEGADQMAVVQVSYFYVLCIGLYAAQVSEIAATSPVGMFNANWLKLSALI